MLILIPTLNRTEELKKCIESIQTQYEYDIIIVNNGDEDEHIEYTMTLEEDGLDVLYFPEFGAGTKPPYPSVAASWNIALRKVDQGLYQYALISNDDIEFKEKSIDFMIEAADKNPENVILFSNYGWSCYLMTKQGIDKVGYFDENFLFAYMEDIDWFHRKTKLGLKHDTVYQTDLFHSGSASINKAKVFKEMNHLSHGANFDYMKLKWNLDRDHVRTTPKWDHPFNVKELSLKDWILNKDRYWTIRRVRRMKYEEMANKN
jgi:GT2 family glycosyltransferase